MRAITAVWRGCVTGGCCEEEGNDSGDRAGCSGVAGGGGVAGRGGGGTCM